jgi:hypothetical protein
MLDEFDTSKGGPYQIQFEISQPFTSLTGISQTLSVHHFVDGGEQIIHITQFGGSALLFAVCSLIVFKVFLPRRSKPIDDVSADSGA